MKTKKSSKKSSKKSTPKKSAPSKVASKSGLLKDKIITIRINGKDLKALKSIADKLGKRYQTYLGEILHELAVKGRAAK